MCKRGACRYSLGVDPSSEPSEGLPAVGALLDGRYRIAAKIGGGGIGKVYRGAHEPLGNLVAIRTLELDGEGAELEARRGRFEPRAQAAAAVQHDNLVELLDFGSTPACAYFVTELLEGYALADEPGPATSIAPARLVALAMQTAKGLHAAHERGLVHRGLEPSKIFICPTRTGAERVKVLELGLAQACDALELKPGGLVFGPPSYMAPEQARADALDARADVYSLGCVLFEALMGRAPFLGDSPEALMTQHLQQAPPSFAALRPELELPAALEQLVRRCLAKEPAQRFASMEAVCEALASLELPAPSSSSPELDGSSAASTPAPRPKPKLAERHPVLAQLAFLYLSQSHSTDNELAASELALIGRELHAWKPMTSLRQIAGLVAFVREEYEALGTQDARQARTREVVDSLRAQLSEEQRRHALASMWKIAGADGEIIDAERRFISMTAEQFSAEEPELESQAGGLEDQGEHLTLITTELPAMAPAGVEETHGPYEPTQFMQPLAREPTAPLALDGPPMLDGPPLLTHEAAPPEEPPLLED